MNKIKVFENENEYIEFSAESAEILLCKQLLNPINFDYAPFVINHFNPNWLRTEERKDLFKIAKKFFEVRESIPSEATMKEIFKNKKYEEKETELLEEYEKIINFDEKSLDEKLVGNTIKTFIKSKCIYFAILDNVQRIEADGEIGDLLSKFEQIIQLDMSDDLGVEYFENLDKHIEELLNKTNRLPFGLTELDKVTYGGLPTDDTCLFVIMAQPGLGKSMLMANIAYNWVLKNKKVLIVSLEMSENMYSRRFDSLFTNINPNLLPDHTSELKSIVQGVKAGTPNALLQIKEFPTGTLTTAMLKQYLKKLKTQKKFEPDIIFVDYLNIMRPNGANSSISLYEKGEKTAEDLRAMSSEMKIPIVTAVQSNRQSARWRVCRREHRHGKCRRVSRNHRYCRCINSVVPIRRRTRNQQNKFEDFKESSWWMGWKDLPIIL